VVEDGKEDREKAMGQVNVEGGTEAQRRSFIQPFTGVLKDW